VLRLLRAAGAAALAAVLAGAPGGSRAQVPPSSSGLPPPPGASSPLASPGELLEPRLLLYSDDPEYVSQDGLLFRSAAALDAGTPARAYLYHVLQDPGQRLALIVESTGAGTSQVRWLGGAAAGDAKPMYVGHRATVEYLRARKARASSTAAVAPGAPLVVPVVPSAVLPANAVSTIGAADGFLPGRPLVQAIYDLRVLSGGPVRLSVVAVHPGADPLAAAAQPLPSDGYHRRGEFSLAGVAPLRLRFTVGDPCDADHACAPFSAGMASFAELHGGRPLGGEYGVLRPVELTMTNPTSAPRDVFLYEQAGTAGVTTTIAFDGDDAPTEVPCLVDLDGHYLVKRFTLAPGERRVATGAFLTDGGSHFPLELGLTAIPPALPADQCAGGPHPSAGPAGSG
jgi:hypothetical protein